MTVKEGKNFLRNCLSRLRPEADIDSLIHYKYANRKSISDYQSDDIVASLTKKDTEALNKGIPYVVKCFIHAEIYVAWPQSIGRENEKYVVYKRELTKMENNLGCDFKDTLIGHTEDAHAYIFRGESGVMKFFRDIVFSDEKLS